jgi:hypothetical protein
LCNVSLTLAKTMRLPSLPLFLATLALCVLPVASMRATAAAGDTMPPLPDTQGHDPATLTAVRERIRDGETTPAFARLIRDADKALALKPASVLDKTKIADSRDPHDYFSLGPYWWPDPAKPDGRPYIRRDGDVNPESKTGTDAPAFSRTCKTVELLGLAYHLAGKNAYAEKAAQLTRVWFLDPATRMNPNLTYAQGIPGRTASRGTGILESRHLASLTDGLALIDGSPAWTAADRTAMRAWLETFYAWLTTSKNGRDEAAAENNHGIWYDVQAAHLELALGKKETALTRIKKQLPARVASQIKADGRQPHELARTNSLGYSLFNLEALIALAQLGERAGWPGGWNYATKDGRGIRIALAYVAPHIDPAKTWPKKDLKPGATDRLAPLLRAFLARQVDAPLLALYEKFGDTPENKAARWQLLLPPPRK